MSNPFSGEFIPYDYDLGLLDRYYVLQNLEDNCAGRRLLNRRFISPRGTGKTTLLEAFFSPERCEELAQKRKLVRICRFSGEEMRTEAAVLVRLIDAVKESLSNLDPDSRDYQKLSAEILNVQEKYPNYRSNAGDGDLLLRGILELLSRRRYNVTLVLDEFHQLACAKHLEDSTFSKMASLAQENRISYIVASDYDDDVGSETYYISPFTRIFNDTIHMEGITSVDGKRALIELIRSKLVRRPNIVLTDQELQTIIRVTAGIPSLVQNTLKDIFQIKEETDEELTEDQISRYALSACGPLMEKWVQYFDDARWETMAVVLHEVTESRIKARLTKEQDKRTSLCNAGLLFKNTRTQEYRTICPLFTEYVRGELARRSPAEHPVERGTQVINNYYHVEQGGTLVQNGEGSTVTVTQNHLHQGVSIPELLSLLGTGSSDSRELFASRLSEQLRSHLSAGSFPALSRGDYETDEEYELAYDEAFAQYSQNMVEDVEVDEDQELAVSQEEIQTLESRFQQARERCRANLDEAFLSSLSERCQFYIKLSVVVEDALELPGIRMEDYSPQLVLYGKALEQALRDSFYPLFHKEKNLSGFSVSKNSIKETFANSKPSQTTIGSYTNVISARKSYLAGLCSKHAIRISDEPGEDSGVQKWWNNFHKDINGARKIRNKADHADPVSPDRMDLNEMCDLLFGTKSSKGILTRSRVGEELDKQIFPPEIPKDMTSDLIGQTCVMRCTVVKKNGGIKGSISGCKYPVNISRTKVQEFYKNHACEGKMQTGKELQVKILEIRNQDGVDFYAAEIVRIEN